MSGYACTEPLQATRLLYHSLIKKGASSGDHSVKKLSLDDNLPSDKLHVLLGSLVQSTVYDQ